MALVFLGIGSNQNRSTNIRAGVTALHHAFAAKERPLYLSRVFESAAVGFAGKAFYNLVVGFHSALPILTIQSICKEIELAHGREPQQPKFSSRSLDIDLLLYDDVIMREPVQVPRDEILTNAFVLWPLSELAPTLQHPITHCSLASLWQNYHSTQTLQPIELQLDPLPYLQQGPVQ